MYPQMCVGVAGYCFTQDHLYQSYHLYHSYHGGTGRGGVVKACQDGLGHFFYVCPFDREGGGSKAIWVVPI